MANPSLSTKQQRSIEILIRKWSTKLSWALLVKSINCELGIVTTRQTLNTYLGIKNEFQVKKQQLRGVSPALIKEVSVSSIKMHESLKKREAEIAILNKQVAMQLAYIERMLANASEIPNIDLKDLVKQRV